MAKKMSCSEWAEQFRIPDPVPVKEDSPFPHARLRAICDDINEHYFGEPKKKELPEHLQKEDLW